MIAIPTLLRRSIQLLAAAVLTLPQVSLTQCAGIREEGRWRNLDSKGEPSYIDIKMLGGCGDQVLKMNLVLRIQNRLSNCAKVFSSNHSWRAFSLAARNFSQPEDVFTALAFSLAQTCTRTRLAESFQRLSPGRKL